VAQTDDSLLTFGPNDIVPRQRALFDQYERYLREGVESAYARRGRFWNRDFSGPDAYERSVEPNRARFLASLGGWPWERTDLAVEREHLADLGPFRVERVRYTLFERIRTDALLLVPKADGPFPAVLCQIGVNGAPETVCGFTEIGRRPDNAYHRIGSRLAAHGYVVLATRMVSGVTPGTVRDQDHRAPHLMTPRQRDIRDWLLAHYGKEQAKDFNNATRARIYLDRLCRMLGGTLMGMEMFVLSRGVDLLSELAEVSPGRIGMYGLSQGGMSALWLPVLEKRIVVSVASAFFNERYHKQVVPSEHYQPFLLTSSEDKIFPHLHEFADSDLASLICPRAFAVEAGKQDGSVWWKLAERAFGEAEAIYERLGLGEKCGFFFHEGGHEVELEEETDTIRAVRFLDRWLRDDV
jgi:dienelactone hydrolase